MPVLLVLVAEPILLKKILAQSVVIDPAAREIHWAAGNQVLEK
jgi:hypothetical protein